MLTALRVRSDEAIRRNWPYPRGLRRFSCPAALLLVTVAMATVSSSRLADTIKSLATRPEGIFEMGSDSKPMENFREIIFLGKTFHFTENKKLRSLRNRH